MPNGLEIAKAAIDDYKKIQRYMLLAKKENATETYAELKEEYLSLKAILNIAGVNLAEIDKIEERFPNLPYYRVAADWIFFPGRSVGVSYVFLAKKKMLQKHMRG